MSKQALHVSDVAGSDETGDGSIKKPFKTLLKVSDCYDL
jgi:hypothetical protein